MAIYYYSYTDAFPLIDVGDSRQKYALLADTLITNESIAQSPKHITVSQELFVTERIQYHYSVRNISFIDTLNLTQIYGPTKQFRITDTLVLTDSGEQYGFSESLDDTLEFSESITLTGSARHFNVSSVLTFVERIYNNLFRGSSPLPVNIDITHFDSDVRNPIAGPPPSCYPPHEPFITFEGIGTLVLPPPEFGNKDTYNVIRVNVRSRGNELIIFAPDYWGKDKVIDFDFNIYDKDTVSSLQDFVTKNLGTIVTLTDHESNQWSGIILTGALDVKMPNFCHWTTSLSFQRFL